RGGETLGHRPGARIGGEVLQRIALATRTAIARDEDAEEDLIDPRAEVRAPLVLLGELQRALDGVLDDVVGRRGITAESARAAAQLRNELDEPLLQTDEVVGNDGGARRALHDVRGLRT